MHHIVLPRRLILRSDRRIPPCNGLQRRISLKHGDQRPGHNAQRQERGTTVKPLIVTAHQPLVDRRLAPHLPRQVVKRARHDRCNGRVLNLAVVIHSFPLLGQADNRSRTTARTTNTTTSNGGHRDRGRGSSSRNTIGILAALRLVLASRRLATTPAAPGFRLAVAVAGAEALGVAFALEIALVFAAPALVLLVLLRIPDLVVLDLGGAQEGRDGDE